MPFVQADFPHGSKSKKLDRILLLYMHIEVKAIWPVVSSTLIIDLIPQS
jgi:hypothetical protein